MKSILPTLRYVALTCVVVSLFSCEKDDSSSPNPENPEFGSVEYIKTFGGSGLDEAVSVVMANDGNYILLGTTESTDGDIDGKTTTDSDYWVLKVSQEGTILWNKVYGGSSDDKATSIKKTNDGGYIVSGYSRSDDGDVSENSGFHDYWIVKLDGTGNLQWEKSFGYPGSDQALNVLQTSDGGYFTTGFLDVTASNGEGNDTRGTLHGVGEYWGIRMDANGNKIWRNYFGGTNNDRSYDAIQTPDGGFLMAGASESTDFDITDDKGSYDYWLVKVNANGEKQWTRSYGGSEIDVCYAIANAEGGYIMVGDARSSDQDVTNAKGNADLWAVKVNTTGDIVWKRNLGGEQFDSARSITPMGNGEYLLSGTTRSTTGDVSGNNGQNDLWTLIIDEQGVIQYEATFGGSSFDFGDAAIPVEDNKIIVVGNTESNDMDIPQFRGVKDVLLIKIQ